MVFFAQILLVSPEKIVLSGGVLQRQVLFPKIRAKTQEYLNSYINVPAVVTSGGIDQLIVPSKHGNNAGIIGALFLAKVALLERTRASSATTPGPKKMASWLVPFLAGIAAGAIGLAGLMRR